MHARDLQSVKTTRNMLSYQSALGWNEVWQNRRFGFDFGSGLFRQGTLGTLTMIGNVKMKIAKILFSVVIAFGYIAANGCSSKPDMPPAPAAGSDNAAPADGSGDKVEAEADGSEKKAE